MITVNGDAVETATAIAEVTIADLVAERTESPKGVAVALNGEVVPRSAWDGTRVVDGDRVEILTAAQGG